MIIGARILKTGLAVTLSIAICRFLNIEPASFAAITAVVNMQPSVRKSLSNAWQQLGVHLLAVTLAILVGTLLGTNPLLIGLTVIIMIVICNRIGLSGAIVLGIVSVIFVLDSPHDQFLAHATSRSLAIFIGLGVALAVNRVLAPPRYKERFLQGLNELYKEASNYFLMSLNTFISSASLRSFKLEEPIALKKTLDDVVLLYEYARDELDANDNFTYIERLLEISRGFIERGQSINEMTSQRVKRLQAPDSPLRIGGVTPEFQNILDILSEGEQHLIELSQNLVVGIEESRLFGPYSEDLAYWGKFDHAIDSWQRKVSGVFYLRALMEVAVVATEIRWAERRISSLHNLRLKNPITRKDR